MKCQRPRLVSIAGLVEDVPQSKITSRYFGDDDFFGRQQNCYFSGEFVRVLSTVSYICIFLYRSAGEIIRFKSKFHLRNLATNYIL